MAKFVTQSAIPTAENLLMQQLVRGLESATEMIRLLSVDLKNLAIAHAILQNSEDAIQDNVATLLKMVRDGNGESLISRIAKLETMVSRIAEKIEDRVKEKAGQQKNKWQLWIALSTGLLALIGTIISHVWK